MSEITGGGGNATSHVYVKMVHTRKRGRVKERKKQQTDKLSFLEFLLRNTFLTAALCRLALYPPTPTHPLNYLIIRLTSFS